LKTLSTVKVLDLSRLLPGPYATLVLADLGAAVDKIEDMAGGDYLRNMPPLAAPSSEPAPGASVPTESTSAAFLALNRGKRSAVVDLKHPDGRALLLKLVEQYDVLVDSFRPGVLERLGLSYDVLREANERLIVCAITGYGQTGPLAGRAGHDLNFLARAGLLGLQGPAEGPPAVPGVQLADVGAALFAVIGILSALMERNVTGRGRVVDIAMVEAAAPFGIFGLSAALTEHARPRGEDLLTGGLAAYGTYETADGGAVALASLEPKFWASFCQGIGRSVTLEDLIPGPHQAELAAELKRVFASKPLEAWRAFDSAASGRAYVRHSHRCRIHGIRGCRAACARCDRLKRSALSLQLIGELALREEAFSNEQRHERVHHFLGTTRGASGDFGTGWLT
jgi:alpha-methylacyl-CoA racemase